MTSVLLSWRSLSIRFHHYGEEPPYSWWIFTLSLAPLPRGRRGKAAAGQTTTTNQWLFENFLYLNPFFLILGDSLPSQGLQQLMDCSEAKQ